MIVTDTLRAVAETLITSFIPVDYRQDKGLRGVKQLELPPVEVLLKGLRRFVVCNPCPIRLLQRGVSDFSEVKLMETLHRQDTRRTCDWKSPTSLKSN